MCNAWGWLLVQPPPTQQAFFMGASVGNIVDAELSAQVWALGWLLQCRGLDGVPASIHYDSQYAAALAQAASANSAHAIIASLAFSLSQCVGQQRAITFHHVKAHEGHPWNEVADSLCAIVRKRPVHAQQAHPIAELCREHAASIPWLIFHHLGAGEMQAYAGGDPGQMRFTNTGRFPLQLTASEIAMRIDVPPDLVRHPFAPRVLRCLSFNACTRRRPGQNQLFANQFARAGVLMAGIQETRSRKAGVFNVGDFVVIATAANDEGQYGVDFWVNTSVVVGQSTHRGEYLKRSSLTVIHQDPRRLFVDVQCSVFSLLAIVLHCPYGTSRAAKQWYEQTESLMQDLAKDKCTIAFIDANAQVGREIPGVSGGFGPPKHSLSAGLFVPFCLKSGLSLPSTFREFARHPDREAQCTFFPRDAGMNPCRIDYIACSQDVQVQEHGANVWQDFESASSISKASSIADHLPVCLDVVVSNTGQSQWRRRKVAYDRSLLSNPKIAQQVSAQLQNVPVIPYGVEPTSHAHLLEHCVNQAILKVLPPRVGPRKRQRYMTDTTFEQVKECKSQRRARAKAWSRIRKAPMLCTFLVWKKTLKSPCRSWKPSWSPLFAFACWEDVLSMIKAHVQHCVKIVGLASLLQLERLAHIAKVLDDEAALLETGCPLAAHRVAAKTTGGGKRAAIQKPMLRAGGAMTYNNEREAFKEHFAKSMQASRSTMMALIEDERAHTIKHSDCFLQGETREDKLADIPSMFEVMGYLKRCSHHKAIGEDLVPDELLRACPQAALRLIHPLIVKSAATLRPPLQWRGGQILELYKGKGPAADVCNYRDVCLASTWAKVYGKCWRTRLASRLRELAGAQQYGAGLNSGDTAVAHLLVRSMQDAATVGGCTLGLIFVDIVSAFPSLMRGIALDSVGSDVALLARLSEMGFSNADIEAIKDELLNTEWMSGSMTKRQFEMLGKLHSFTWASVDGTTGILKTERGTAAGLPLSDAIFIAAVGRVLVRIDQAIADSGLNAKLKVPPSVRSSQFGQFLDVPAHICFSTVGFVDDLVFPVLAKPEDIACQITTTTEIIADSMAHFGFQLNPKRNKTEAMITWIGKGMVAARKKLLIDDQALLHCCPDDHKMFSLRIVRSYQHLGTEATVSGHMGEEVVRRMSVMGASARKIRKKLLGNALIPMAKRCLIAQSHAFSRGFFQCGTWTHLSMGVRSKIHHATMMVYRMLLEADMQVEKIRHLNDLEVLARLRVLPPMVILRLFRLKLAAKLVRSAPPPTWHLLCVASKNPGSWLEAVAKDLNHLGRLPQFKDQAGFTFVQWFGLLRAQPKFFARLRDSLLSAEALRADWWASEKWHHKLVGQANAEWPCYECGMAFVSRQALATHSFRVHGTKRFERQMVETTWCPICLVQFHTRMRCVQHLSIDSTSCRECLLEAGVFLTRARADELDCDDRAHNRHLHKRGHAPTKAELPAFRLPGPLKKAFASRGS